MALMRGVPARSVTDHRRALVLNLPRLEFCNSAVTLSAGTREGRVLSLVIFNAKRSNIACVYWSE